MVRQVEDEDDQTDLGSEQLAKPKNVNLEHLCDWQQDLHQLIEVKAAKAISGGTR